MKQASVRGPHKDKDRGIPCAPKIVQALYKALYKKKLYEDTETEKGTFLHSKFSISGGPVHWRHRQRRPCTSDVTQYRLMSVMSPERNQETGSTLVDQHTLGGSCCLLKAL